MPARIPRENGMFLSPEIDYLPPSARMLVAAMKKQMALSLGSQGIHAR
jgi:hypothetical protein